MEREVKTIKCIVCSCDVIITKNDYRTKRCREHQREHLLEYQNNYQKKYFHKYHKVKTSEDGRERKYIKRNQTSENDLEYCKNNWDSVQGCLNCIIPDCIQETANDTMLPWENEGFYENEYQDNI